MKKLNFISSRKYLITFIEGETVDTRTHTLRELCEDEDDTYEYKYAIQEEFDAILDLKVGEHLRMQFNRDNFDSQGVIKRIK